VGKHHTDGAPGLDFLDNLSQATGNAKAPDRESVRHACLWEATIVLFSGRKVAYERKRKIMRNVASVAELKESYFAEIDKSFSSHLINILEVHQMSRLLSASA
jgi:hypothetical protein